MILADANIWIDYFRSGDLQLRSLLNNRQIVMHPFLTAELALGSLRDRLRVLSRLDRLPQARVVALSNIRQMIEARSLYARGIGLIDAHLVASCLITPGTVLWTRDAALKHVAKTVGVEAGLP